MAKVIRASVSFEPQDIEAIKPVMRKVGGKLSVAVRFIIREWLEMKAQERINITEAGRQALHDDPNLG